MHVLGIAHSVAHPDYVTCAFSQKILKFCKMMRKLGHYVIFYGHADSIVDCDEFVPVTTDADLRESYGDHDWRTQGFPTFNMTTDRVYKVFNGVTIGEIHRRKQPGDFLICSFGVAHQAIGEAHADMIVTEATGVGYPATFSKFKVYESYAAMHALYGPDRLKAMFTDGWYDCVIPNYFDLDDFDYRTEKDDYFLFLGRIGPGKGSDIASSVVKEIGGKLVVAGMGQIENAPHIYPVGVVGPEKRRNLLSHAKAVICASTYIEPFCGVMIEALLSGTPVISTDWGAFCENNIHGVTGYRCRTFEQFVWAAKNISNIRPDQCRQWAEANFSMERVAQMYEEFFWSLAKLHGGGGWDSLNPERTNLDWLNRVMPSDPPFEMARAAE